MKVRSIVASCRRIALLTAVAGATLFQTTSCSLDDTMTSLLGSYLASEIITALTSSSSAT